MTREDIYKGHALPLRRSHSKLLLEYGCVKQVDGEPYRRWFRSRQMDLTVWYSAEGDIEGFQLCYDCDADERALTWTAAQGYAHDQVDQGEGPRDKVKMKMTPILRPDGAFDNHEALRRFKCECHELPHEIVEFVRTKLEEYEPAGNA